MGDQLKVDPIDLRMSSDHMDMHHCELRAAHASANDVMEGAQPGWVGASAAALQSKMAEWQATTTKLCGDVAAHGAAYLAAADGYARNDTNLAEALHHTL
jgi:WXG100 family type VII secretion target